MARSCWTSTLSSETFQCTVVDAKDNPAQQALSVASILYPDAVWLVLPFDSSLRF
jgi:hypothetical protein